MFEQKIIDYLLSQGLTTDDSVLVVCGGSFEHDLLLAKGFKNVTISNLDEQYSDKLAPYQWSRQDAERLTYADMSFDVVLVHAGLHHCHSPHRGMLEMFRVARKAIAVFEAGDNLLAKIGKLFGFGSDFEIEAVSGAHFRSGGVANTAIPNFVYRWTRNEVVKTISSYEPRFVPRIRMFYGLNLPFYRFGTSSRPLLRAALHAIAPVVELLTKLLPGQGNQFGFVVFKDGALQPWLKREADGTIVTSPEAVAAMGLLYRDAPQRDKLPA